jgi:predicted RecB family endonuclease
VQNKLTADLEMVKHEIDKIIQCKQNWKSGKATLDDVQKEFLNRYREPDGVVVNRSSIDAVSIKRAIKDMKVAMVDLMEDVQSLSKYDFKKMMKSEVNNHVIQIFTYDVYSPANTDKKILEAKDILQQIKNNYFGCSSAESHISVDLENEHTDLMLRNLKCRLNQALRENLELKVLYNIFVG